METKVLDAMVKSGILKHYEVVTYDRPDPHVIATDSPFRKTEEVKLVFKLGEVLVINNFSTEDSFIEFISPNMDK